MAEIFDTFEKRHDFLICVDSDGCAMDTMDIDVYKRQRQNVAALHHAGQAHHVRSVGQDHTIEAQFLAEQALQQFRAESGGHDVFVFDGRIDFTGPGGLHDVACHHGLQTAVDQAFVHFSVSGHPGIAVRAVDTGGQVLVTLVNAVAGEVLGRTAEAGILVCACLLYTSLLLYALISWPSR